MKGFFDWLLQQIGDGLLITATLAILRNIAKGWLEAYWPQNEKEDEGDETGTDSESESESEGGTSTNSSVSENDDDQDFISSVMYNCTNFAHFLKERKYSKKIYLSTSDIGVIVVHMSLIREFLLREILNEVNETNIFNGYIEKLKQCKELHKTDIVILYALMDQLELVLIILETYSR